MSTDNAGRFDYDVFISYRSNMHPDREAAEQLQKVLESYAIPAGLESQIVAARQRRKRLKVFRDRTDLSASANLTDSLKEKLHRSRYLIVVCTPHTPDSAYCREEIRQFREYHGADKILALLAQGEPAESFPAELRTPSPAGPIEPLAADIRARDVKGMLRRLKGQAEPRPLQARFMLLSAVLGCRSSNDLVRRHEARTRLQFGLVAVSLLIISGLAAFGGSAVIREKQARSIVAKLLPSTETETSALLPELAPVRRWAGEMLREELRRVLPPEPDRRYEFFARRSNAVVALVRLGDDEPLRLLLDPTDDPAQAAVLIERYGPSGGDLDALLRGLDHEAEPRVRQGLVLALGGFSRGRLKSSSVAAKLLDLYPNDPDPGVHAAAAWVWEALRRENQIDDDDLRRRSKIDRELAKGEVAGDRRWYHLKHYGQAMTIVPAGDYWYGDTPARRNIEHTYAIAATETTVEQMLPFLRSVNKQDIYDRTVSDADHSPINSVSWYLAAAYCNWLSRAEGVTEDQWCYEPNSAGEFADGMTIHSDRSGYRLPTEEEWEQACRAGTSTSYNFGDVPQLLNSYAWCLPSSKVRRGTLAVAKLKPNAFGLFDMHGNVQEWCQSEFTSSSNGGTTVYGDGDRVLRSGSFRYASENCVAPFRTAFYPINRDVDVGFRIARTLD